MPLPESEFCIIGGCNCGAVGYRIDVPELAQRPQRLPDDKDSHKLPYATLCLCKDCRKASGGTIYHVITAHVDSISLSSHLGVADASTSSGAQPGPAEAERPLTGRRGFTEGSIEALPNLGVYASSKLCRRYFCTTCGTHLAFRSFDPDDQPLTEVVDILLGTVDDLDHDWWEPIRLDFFDECPKWLQQFSQHGYPDVSPH